MRPDSSAQTTTPLFADVPVSTEIPEKAPMSADGLQSWEEQEKSYQRRLPASLRAFNESNDPRALAAKDLIQDLRTSKIGKLAKVEFVNEWVNRSIGYEKRKMSRMTEEGIRDVDWHQPPGETIERGTGACSDIARLKQHMLAEIGVSQKDMWLVGGALHDKELVAGQERAFLAYHEQLVVDVEGQKYVLNDNRNMGNKKAGGIEPMGAQFRGETPNAWGTFDAYAVTQGGEISYLDSNQAWLATHDPSKIGQDERRAHAPNRRAMAMVTADATTGTTFDVPAGQKKEMAQLANKHLKDAIKFNPFGSTGGEQPGERDRSTLSPAMEAAAETQTALQAVLTKIERATTKEAGYDKPSASKIFSPAAP